MKRFQRALIWTVIVSAALLLAALHAPAGATNRNAVAAAPGKATQPKNRPSSWAVKRAVPGVPNFHQVTTNLYRGAQPTAKGMAELKTLGIKTVINLRADYSDTKRLADTGLKSVRFTTVAWRTDEEDVIQFLKVVADTNNLPAFVHCQRGADRTGLACAMYRVVFCGWSKEDAIQEMAKGGFGFNPLWKNLTTFVEKADIARLKQQAGIGPKQP